MTTRMAIAALIHAWLAACGEDAEGDGIGGYLGSSIAPALSGGVLECTNYYAGGASTGAQMMALKSVLNRTEPCPVKDALGACELPVSASPETMTQNEMVYYQKYLSSGKPAEDDEYTRLKDGDDCGRGRVGVWRKPYTATPPAKASPYVPKRTTKYYSCLSNTNHNCGEVELTTDKPADDAYKILEDFMADCSKPGDVGSTKPDSCPHDNREASCRRCSEGGCVGVTSYMDGVAIPESTLVALKEACERQSGSVFTRY